MGLSLVHSALALLQQHQPWLADKIGGALAAQPVRELWDQLKRKFGSSATEKFEANPDDAGQREVLKVKLIIALDEDTVFREKIQELVTLADEKAISQTANGTVIRQIGVNRSED